MFDISFDKIVVIGIIAAFIIGSARLPEYATKLAQFVRRARVMIESTQDKVKDELGPEFQDIDWKKLDPRRYDPRQIIRDSLLNDDTDPNVERVPVVRLPAKEALDAGAAEPALDSNNVREGSSGQE